MNPRHRSPTTLPAALAGALRDDPARPLVTFYDDATGERVELSVKTFDNWVSKVANLFGVDLGLEPGDQVAITLPPHWQSMVVASGAWTAGLTLQLDPDAAVAAHVVGPEQLGAAKRRDAEHVIACSLRPLGARFDSQLPAGWLDFAAEVPPQPDAPLTGDQSAAHGTAVASAGEETTHDGLVERGLEAAAGMDLRPRGRLVTDHNPADPTGLVPALAAPLAVGAAVVIVAPTTAERRTAITTQERATVIRWTRD